MPALHGPEAHQHPTLMHVHYSDSIFLCHGWLRLPLWKSAFEELYHHIRNADALVGAADFHPLVRVGRDNAIQSSALC